MCVGGLLSPPTGTTAWQGATPLGGFGHMTSHLAQPTTSSANQWPDVFGDSPVKGGVFAKKPNEAESKKQTSESSKGVWCVHVCVHVCLLYPSGNHADYLCTILHGAQSIQCK